MTRLALHVLFFLSGAAALGYQLVWAKMFSTGLGHEMPAMLAIIAAFMAGMAPGAAVLDRFIPRDARAGLWLCGLELTIGAWALLITFLIPSANDFALRLIGLAPGGFRHWLIAFTIPALVLLPATVAIGGTLPAMEKFLSDCTPEKSSVGSVYAANTLGAVAGTLLVPFVLMPALGFSRTCWVLVVVNGGVGVGTWTLARRLVRAGSAGIPPASSSSSRLEARAPRERAASAVRGPLTPRRLTLTLFFTGLLGIAYETLGVRVLSQVLEGTVFTYAAVLAIFLLGTAAGAAAFHRWWRRVEPARLHASLLNAAAGAGFLGILALSRTPLIYKTLRAFGDAPGAVLVAELLTAFTVFAPVTFCMGALFSHLLEEVRGQSTRIGGVLALNTLGAALAPVFVLVLLPWAGAKVMLGIACLGYLLLALPDYSAKFIGIVFVLGLFANRSNLQVVDAPPGSRVISHREGIMATVVVTEDANTNRTLRVDNRYQMGGTAAADAEYRQAHLPLLLHPNPRRALFLGVGTGISLGAASLYPQLQADAVELVPEVVDAMKFFEAKNFSAAQFPNFKLHTADARRFVRATDQIYDVIVADLFHPYRDGAGALYTREHFAAIRRQLNPNSPSLFCQWLPLHQLDEATLRVIVRTFESVFPNCEAWLLRFNVEVPVVALVGWTGTPHWSPTQVKPRLDAAALGPELKRLALADSLRVFGHLLADADDLSRFAINAPLNTDDNQRVTFMAPRAAYQHDEKPYASLLALLTVSKTERIIGERLLPPANADFAARLTRYLAARNVYLRGLVYDTKQRRDEAIDSYIESARLSPDFTTGYAQGLSIANVLAGSDPTKARKILERLIEAQPEQAGRKADVGTVVSEVARAALTVPSAESASHR